MSSQSRFDFAPAPPLPDERIGEQALVLRGFALPYVDTLLPSLQAIEQAAPFRQLITPGGFTMSVAMTNCGTFGWTSDRRGYRYTRQDPQTNLDWPPLPACFLALARAAANAAGFPGFTPDACLINRYLPGTRMSLHQDKDERDLAAPIVSVSLGIPAIFQFGGHARTDKPQRLPLFDGDVVVWGGVDRLRYHGVLPMKAASDQRLGACRLNLTFRKAS